MRDWTLSCSLQSPGLALSPTTFSVPYHYHDYTYDILTMILFDNNVPQDPSIVQVLGEKTSFKTVGAVAMEAFDSCILEFGKSNPILQNIKSALLPLIFAENKDMEKLETPIRADEELAGSKYLSHSTWLEDAHFMYEHAEKEEKAKNKLKYSLQQNYAQIEKLETEVSTQNDSVEPLKQKVAQLQVSARYIYLKEAIPLSGWDLRGY